MNSPENNESGFNRRNFLKGSSFAALMTMMGGVPLIAEEAKEGRKIDPALNLPKARIAVIGLGPWGREILDQLGRCRQAEVVAICDNYPAMVRKAAPKAPTAAQVEDYKAVIANKDVTAVVVATGTHQHKDVVIEALKAGKHVYCEAPLANTMEDAQAIARAAQDAVGYVFQAGLQDRADPQRHFLVPFIRSGALGQWVMARAQWHKKASWRQPSPNPEREKAINWRLNQATSTGLAGEVGIHHLDQARWFFGKNPVAVQGFSSLLRGDNDGREVPDTVQLVLEYPDGVRMMFDATLATSFEASSEVYYGSNGAVMVRDGKAWMFKEVDSPLLGWEPYARKDTFHNDSVIALVMGGSKQAAATEDNATAPAAEAPALPPLYHALDAFSSNAAEMTNSVADFKESYGNADKKALSEYLATLKLRPTATVRDGYAATVLAIKANEAVVGGKRVELNKEWFELA